MVLEGATASDSSFADTFPSSDTDPYASGNTSDTESSEPTIVRVSPQPNAVYINLHDLPRRWSLIGEKPHPQVLVNGVQDSCRFASNVLQRPVTQDEANAFAFHFAKSIRIGSFGTPFGVLIGTGLAYRTQKDMRFPFWSPFKEGSRFSKDSFFTLKGPLARSAWQFLRFNVYWVVGAFMGQIFMGSYALSVSLTGRAIDPRLKEFQAALKQRMQNGVGREGAKRVEDESAGPRGMETYDMARQRRSAQDIGRRGRQQSAGEGADDASPTGGAFGDEYMEREGASGFMSEDEVRREADSRLNASREQRPQQSYGQSAVASRPSTTEDASPSLGRETPTKASGSAWDRLRQEAMTGEQKRSFQGSSPSASAGARAPARGSQNASSADVFGFSSSDEDRQLAKAEAQSEFDARMERERHGGDFSEGGGKRGRW